MYYQAGRALRQIRSAAPRLRATVSVPGRASNYALRERREHGERGRHSAFGWAALARRTQPRLAWRDCHCSVGLPNARNFGKLPETVVMNLVPL